jgi:hypothetical protein
MKRKVMLEGPSYPNSRKSEEKGNAGGSIIPELLEK